MKEYSIQIETIVSVEPEEGDAQSLGLNEAYIERFTFEDTINIKTLTNQSITSGSEITTGIGNEVSQALGIIIKTLNTNGVTLKVNTQPVGLNAKHFIIAGASSTISPITAIKLKNPGTPIVETIDVVKWVVGK